MGHGLRARPRALGGQQDDPPDPGGGDDIEDSARVLTGHEELPGKKEEQRPGPVKSGLEAFGFREVGLPDLNARRHVRRKSPCDRGHLLSGRGERLHERPPDVPGCSCHNDHG
jgi:hypothetical protein